MLSSNIPNEKNSFNNIEYINKKITLMTGYAYMLKCTLKIPKLAINKKKKSNQNPKSKIAIIIQRF